MFVDVIPRDVLLKRFQAKVNTSDSGCHEWQANLNYDGYGRMKIGAQYRQAHRIAYELFVGPIPDRMMVCHRCDNRKCVNPAHLYIGTAKQNATDAKERDRLPRGEGHYRSRFTTDDVVSMRALAYAGVAISAIARKYKSSYTNVKNIIEGRKWRRAPGQILLAGERRGR